MRARSDDGVSSKRTLGYLVVALLTCAAAAFFVTRTKPAAAVLNPLALPHVPNELLRGHEKLALEPLTPELRKKGFHECNPHDPLGLGPYAPYERLSLGRALIPQKGGHTADMGFDVLVHFHGGEPVRKALVQVTRGLVLVMVDLGTGGQYSHWVGMRDTFPRLRASIEAALKRKTGDPRAHIRHLALSAWSVGSVAINKIIEQHQPGIDAMIILDGMHAGYKPNSPRFPDIRNLEVAFLKPALEVARCAARGETTFVVTHSQIDPVKYPGTNVSADLLLDQLGLERKTLDPGDDPFGQVSTVDVKGLHVWGFRGRNEPAHCIHLALIGRIANEILERQWNTPYMDRSVAPGVVEPWQRQGAGN